MAERLRQIRGYVTVVIDINVMTGPEDSRTMKEVVLSLVEKTLRRAVDRYPIQLQLSESLANNEDLVLLFERRI